MAIYTYEGISGMKAALIDGYLKERSCLLKTAEEVAREIDVSWSKPYSWNSWDDDAVFQYIAYNARGKFCRSKPEDKGGHIWSEAWLLRPEQWANGFTLKNPGMDQSSRRLLISLYRGCGCGDQCLDNVIQKSGLVIIPSRQYRSIKAFKKEAEDLLYDACLPFEAPCSVAEKMMEEKGYSLKAFGS